MEIQKDKIIFNLTDASKMGSSEKVEIDVSTPVSQSNATGSFESRSLQEIFDSAKESAAALKQLTLD